MTQLSQLSKEIADNEKLVTVKTTMGDVKIKLFPEVAPKTVENFLGLAKKGYYDGVIFHRVIPEFMIQGGDPTGTGMGGESLWGDSFEDEFSTEVFNLYGTLSMANAGPGTNGSQFFIVTAPDGTPWLDNKHTVFGQVIEGMDVVESIQNVKRGPQDKPVNDVVIETIELA
ncbi:peptidyl-prolyl cis-trans isomerase B (cyclophilin B) [Carnobacterium iners]|uniref:Peptidyl-prolyl cis-trans isomerase n=1 Tax=Carnobacterium iners TaxID=1073423 RepID=A0A1X7MNI3_9LACT|nr:peptidylprolyl isomerase [Carnobacterium iners]SEK76741.1 peptidyl-prolyl cis-trans isomerase B (cyclophilin B) [Carnobacterium iners]SMH26390.1 peptidyl-prolyl cis-trans isomerase B (cyclophilin B) [Carnobacterium iners]